jgi:hypothetical protein
MPIQTHAKLGPRFFGPFKILARVGSVAYQMQLPPGACLHDVFHLGLLKKYCGPDPTGPDALPPIRHGRVYLESAEVTKSRLARARTVVLVSWVGQPVASASWVDLAEFQQLYPAFKFVNELVVQEGRDVMFDIKYSCRSKEGSNRIAATEGKSPATEGRPSASDHVE